MADRREAVELAHGLTVDRDVGNARGVWNDRRLQTVATFDPAAEVFDRALIFACHIWGRR